MSGISVVKQVQHYQKSIEKHSDNQRRILYCIEKLYILPVTVQHLQETGVGRTINALRKYEGTVGEAAKSLVAKWKNMVVDEESSDGDDDDVCVPDVSEGYSDNSDSSIDTSNVQDQSMCKYGNGSNDTHKTRKSKSSQKCPNSSVDDVDVKKTETLLRLDEEDSIVHTKSITNSQQKSSHQASGSKTTSMLIDDKIIDNKLKVEKSKNRDKLKRKNSESDSLDKPKKDKKLKLEKNEIIPTCKNKDERKDNDSDRHKEKGTEQESKSKKHKKSKEKLDINGQKGIDCNSGTSFAEALGMCTRPSSSKKKTSSLPSKSKEKSSQVKSKDKKSKSESFKVKIEPTIKPEPSVKTDQSPSLLSPNVKLQPLQVDLASTLPEISPNYKPLPLIPAASTYRKQEDYEDFDYTIFGKNIIRTKVYSGNKSCYTSVPSLYELCIRVIIENIEALEFTGGVPYYIIKPVLERATADQLFMIEHYNPYLIDDTDELWKIHTNREFRNTRREEMESWRDMYMRCLDEREAKLKTLTANIKQSIDKSVPARSTIMAYVDDVVKPPRNILRKQAKYGTAKLSTCSLSDAKKKIITKSTTASSIVSVPAPPSSRCKVSSAGIIKKNKAPLMAKALQLIKGRYKR